MANINRKNYIKSKETKYVNMFIENGIFQCYFKEIETLDLAVAKASVEDRLAFFDKKNYPCLFDITKVKQTTKEARDYMANEGNDLILASAMLINLPVLKMMANFYIMVNKPKNPTRMFTDKESALEWLSQFKK
jgi:hypothetical protein